METVVTRCSCWNPARPMPTKDGGHEAVCPIEVEHQRTLEAARRLIVSAQRRVTKA